VELHNFYIVFHCSQMMASDFGMIFHQFDGWHFIKVRALDLEIPSWNPK
jgi:hypothetical protein